MRKMKVGKRSYKTHTSAAKAISRKKGIGMKRAYAYVNAVQSKIKKASKAKRARRKRRK